MTPPRRTILHVDLDAFFASVAQRDDPTLVGRPVLVGGSVNRGVVAAASYEAREYGIHSAMPMAEAMRRCPHAVIAPHDWDAISAASKQFFEILGDFSPLVQSLSSDEAFVDATGTERLFGDGRAVAEAVKKRVRDEISLVCSVGVAPTKFVAKIASDIDKPDGLCVVSEEHMLSFLHALPVSRLWGVGKVTREKLREIGLTTIGDVAHYPESVLSSRLGPGVGAHLGALARGQDPRPVHGGHSAVTIGHEQTFERDIAERGQLVPILLSQADRVAARLRRAELRTRVVCLKIKYGDFRVVSRRRSLADPTSDGQVIARVAVELLGELPISGNHGKLRRVRLCGVSAQGLEPRDAPRQLTLDEGDRQRGERLGDTLDEIHARFGNTAIKRAVED